MRRRWRNLTPVAAGWVVVAGCGPVAPPAPAAVRGTVTFRGYPLDGGAVVFAPDAERGTAGPPVSASIGRDGQYRLAAGGKVPPGWYKVAIADPPAAPGDYPYGGRFPPALRRPDRSGLSREVRPGQDHVFDFYVDVPD